VSTHPTEDRAGLREVSSGPVAGHEHRRSAANRGPDDGSGLKVGGHQASSASMVTIMTALWFDALSAADRVSVKPHASPVLHAVNHLLGRLDASWLPRLREFGGLQPYPSRTKDPDVPDYSTGSVGIGATAPVWGAIARRYASAHLDVRPGGRQISLLGDAELDEGAVWECVADPLVQRLGEVLWVVDVNRQSLDRIVPEIAVRRWAGMFEAAGWQVLDVKYGRRLQEVFARRGRGPARADRRAWATRSTSGCCAPRPPARAAVGDRGLGAARTSRRGLACAARPRRARPGELARVPGRDNDRPTVVFAYTIKGWRLPIEGHPGNHSRAAHRRAVRRARRRSAATRRPVAPLDPTPPPAGCARAPRPGCAGAAQAVEPAAVPRARPPTGTSSTQRPSAVCHRPDAGRARGAAGRHRQPRRGVAARTRGAGQQGRRVVRRRDRHDWFAEDARPPGPLARDEPGQHLSWDRRGEPGRGAPGDARSQPGRPSASRCCRSATVYGPVRRPGPCAVGLRHPTRRSRCWSARRSGVTLAARGGRAPEHHDAVHRPGDAGVTAYEPAFAVEVEWCLLDALSRLGRPGGESAYLRLSTRPLDQSLCDLPDDDDAREQRRRDVLAGGYRLRTAVGEPAVHDRRGRRPGARGARGRPTSSAVLGVAADVVVVTSYDRLWRAVQAGGGCCAAACTASTSRCSTGCSARPRW
jgi:pyruvate dehydrogenase E1 component